MSSRMDKKRFEDLNEFQNGPHDRVTVTVDKTKFEDLNEFRNRQKDVT